MGTNYEDNGRALGDNYCFACGLDNPYGLKLDFRIEGDRFVTETTLVREYQSYTGVAHGGIVSTLLDEAMGGYLVALGEKAVTGRLSVRYRRPTPRPLRQDESKRGSGRRNGHGGRNGGNGRSGVVKRWKWK